MRYLFVLLMLFGCAAAPQADVPAWMIDEAKAYSAMLTAKMDRGELTEEEARYLYTKKVNELAERGVAERAQRPVYVPRIPRSTSCRPDGLGGVICR